MAHQDSLPPSKPGRRGRRVAIVFLVISLVLAVLALGASKISAGEFAISPGGAQPVAPLIEIRGHSQPTTSGKILLTDVLLTPVTWLNYLWFKADSSTQLIPQDALVPSGVSPSQLDAQGFLEMDQSKQAAKTAALRRLGYPVGTTPSGALVNAVGEQTPASSALSVADVIVGVDGHSTTTSCAVISALFDLPPGTAVTLSVRHATIHDDGRITDGPPTSTHVVLGTRTHPATSTCPGVTGPSRSYLGVSLSDDVTYSYPFAISISTPNIGGPSAGLAMTLGVIDELSGGTLVHHRVLAATGTIDPTGAVGDVGGVPQKTIAVAREGATLFLVPTVELSAARSKAPSTLKVSAVATLDQALHQLMVLGGTIRMADGSTESLTSSRQSP